MPEIAWDDFELESSEWDNFELDDGRQAQFDDIRARSRKRADLQNQLIAEQQPTTQFGELVEAVPAAIKSGLSRAASSVGGAMRGAAEIADRVPFMPPTLLDIPAVRNLAKEQGDVIGDVWTDIAQEQQAKVTAQDLGPAGQTVADVSQMAGQSLPALAAAPIGLPAAATAGALQGFGTTFQEAEKSYAAAGTEDPTGKALTPAVLSGLVTGTITRLFGATGIESLASKEVIKNIGEKGVRHVVSTAIKNFFPEAAEEAIDEAFQSVIQVSSYNPKLTFGDALANVLAAAGGGGLLGSAAGAGRGGLDIARANAVETFPAAPDPDVVARNLAAPGTVRSTEREAFAPTAPEPPADIFQAGDVPFDRMQRFGGQQFPAPTVLPSSGPLPPVEIVEAGPRDLATGGKVSFAAEAPTLTRTAVEPVEGDTVTLYQGQEGGSGGGSFWSTNPKRAVSFGKNVKSVEVPRAVYEQGVEARRAEGKGTSGDAILPNEWANKAKDVEVEPEVIEIEPEPSAIAEAFKQVKSTDGPTGAQEFGWANRSPEGIAEMEKIRADLIAQREAIKADPNLETMQKLNRMAELALPKQFIDEALQVANNDQTRSKVQEFIAKKKAEATTAEPAPSDDIVSKLESWKFNPKPGDVLTIPGLEIPVAIWNGSIDLAIGAIKAGRSITQAVNEAVAYIKKQTSGFDEKKLRKQLEYIISNESKPLPRGASGAAPTPTPPTPAPGTPPAATPPTPAPGAPPTPPPGTPPAPASAPAPGTPPATLDGVYKVFEPLPKKGKSAKERAKAASEAFRTGFSSSFRPLNRLAEDIAKAYGVAKRDVAGIFEQLKGSSGKAEADVYRFDQEVSKAVKGKERDFSAYMFLRRSIDRLNQDAADVAAGKPARRRVSTYTIPELQAKLAALEAKLTPGQRTAFSDAADAFQAHLDTALQLQVSSGRMSMEVYDAIKDGNQFYAPFKVKQYLQDTIKPAGSGRRVETTADYVKAMEGVENPDFRLGDMLAAARNNIAVSRILAEKNKAMRNISDLSAIDVNETYVKKLGPNEDAPQGMDAVTVLENGERVRYGVRPELAQAVQVAGPNSGALLIRMAAATFRAGATTYNLPFQFSNLLADIPRAALVSKYGITLNPIDLVFYPIDMIHAFYSAAMGNVFGRKNQLFLDFLDSGAAGTTVQQYLTPGALEFKPDNGLMTAANAAKATLGTLPRITDTIEQMSKVLGVKRAMRMEGVKSGAELAANVPEAITEIRRFSGSPDFGRMGKWVDQYRLNLMYMFLNARLQGTIADVGRLTGRDGAGTAAKTWAKIGIPIGLLTLYNYLINHSDEYRDDYGKRTENEKRNYWLIPKDKFITGADGEKIRDYWRVPKREISKWVANSVESGLDFAQERDPEAFWKWGQTMAEEFAPMNVQGKNTQERLESIGASLNPLVKAPLEIATGRDMYRHTDIVKDVMKKATPKKQYTDRTAEVFKDLANAMPKIAPDIFESPLMLENMTRNLTAGLFTQFIARKPIEGRTALENNPLLQRFQGLPYTDSSEFEEQMQEYEREAADEQLDRYRNAKQMLDDNKGVPLPDVVKKTVDKFGPDKKLVDRVADLWLAEERGITGQERRILALPTQQRAQFILGELKGKSTEEQAALLRKYTLKRILTTGVAEQMTIQQAPAQ
jgi:hypothetical protein